ncbi:MAG TPA: hypothetical protein VJ124_20360 [Pyrinomonadaceae bacterium]|nr:hypothetical protein [Pyrinomonadaceae bacterium]
MKIDYLTSLEKSLAKTESDAEAALKVAGAAVSSLKKFRAAAKLGNLRELRKTIEAADQAITALRQQFANAKDGWDFDEEAYLSGSAFRSELLETAKQLAVKMFEQDDKLYCYPFLIRILPNERSVLIDKLRERRLRPSVLVSHLKDLQNKPVRFKPETFLDCLFEAYRPAVAARGKDLFGTGVVVKLRDIYESLTRLPGQSKEYSLQEFARDIYLLDQSRVAKTKKGLVVSFPASTGTKSATNTITVITQSGHEKKYYGIAFVNG